MSLPRRWQGLREFFDAVLAPFIEDVSGGLFPVQSNGPDGGSWTRHVREYVDLRGADPALDATRRVAVMCGATRRAPDPGPEAQSRQAMYYSPVALRRAWLEDANVWALAAVVLDVDDKRVGGRDGCMSALERLPPPTFVLHSGGGVQAGYVLKDALEFNTEDEAGLQASARSYLRAAIALQRVAGADATNWPAHLFRLPGAFHLKIPGRPVLVEADLHPARRFALGDFDDLASCVDEPELCRSTNALIARLRGETRARVGPSSGASESTPPRVDSQPIAVVKVPRRVSRPMLALLNCGRHPRYVHADGTLDRSRATYAAAMSLIQAGLSEDEATQALLASALRPAIDERCGYGPRWVAGQVQKASAYLAGRLEESNA